MFPFQRDEAEKLEKIGKLTLQERGRTLTLAMAERNRLIGFYLEYIERMESAIDAMKACNRRCGAVDDPKVEVVIGGNGNNPFNPNDPIGPPVKPPPQNAIGTIQLSSTEYAGGEGGAVLITVTRAEGTKGAVSVQYATGGGTATAGADYVQSNGTLTWHDGDAMAKSFSIPIIDDTAVEGHEYLTVTLTNPGGGATLGSPMFAVVSIADNDSPTPTQPGGNLQFSSSTYSTAEGQGSVLITVTRTGGSTGAVTVQHFTGPASATAGADYQAVNGTLSWANGDTAAKTFTVPIIDDTVVEQAETFFVTLNSPTGGATLGAPVTAAVSIADNDVAPPQPVGTLQFSSSSYATAEGQGSVLITATRSGGSNGNVAVQYSTAPGSAAAGSDYQAVNGTLTWGNGDTSAKSFSVPVVDDTLVEPTETFSVLLSSPAGGATLGSPATATITIVDNDVATGPCGAAGNAWQPNTGAAYNCAGSCTPSPSPQMVTVNGDRVTVSPFHAGGAAAFTGCSAALNSDSTTLIYFSQPIHRATISRSGSNSYSASIVSSSGGTCAFICSRAGP